MRDPFDSFFNPAFRPLKKMPGRSQELPLPDETALTDILARLADGSKDGGDYPLQVIFYEKLLHCGMLLPMPENAVLNRGLPVLLLENERGERGLPVFTSEGAFARWADETVNYLLLPFTTLCGYAMEARVDYLVVNASGPYGCEIGAHDLRYLSEGLLPTPSENLPDQAEVVIEAQTPIRLSASRGLPADLMAQLTHVFRYHQHWIEQVYLFEIGISDGPLQPALGVRMPMGEEAQWEQSLWPNLQAILNEMLESRSGMSVFLLNESGNLEQYILEVTCPIFSRNG